jgi:hypothetical protein
MFLRPALLVLALGAVLLRLVKEQIVVFEARLACGGAWSCLASLGEGAD